jgi:hypothetical protein
MRKVNRFLNVPPTRSLGMCVSILAVAFDRFPPLQCVCLRSKKQFSAGASAAQRGSRTETVRL